MTTEEFITSIHNKYGAKLYNYAKRFVSIENADDILQESYIKIMIHFEKKKVREDAPASFFYRVVHNLCIDWLRKNKIKIVDDDSTLDMQADLKQTPEIEARRNSFRQLIKNEMLKLDPTGLHYAILILTQDRNLSQIEIAQITKKSTATIRRKMTAITSELKEICDKNNIGIDFFDAQ